jgi:tetratricopeptide (TPR) repeat protein
VRRSPIARRRIYHQSYASGHPGGTERRHECQRGTHEGACATSTAGRDGGITLPATKARRLKPTLQAEARATRNGRWFTITLMRSRIAFVLFGLHLFGADARWIKLKSAHFEMYSSASERNARETLKYFEQVRSFFQQGMGNIPGKALPVRIIAFNSQKEYEPYSLNNFATAFYSGTPTVDNIVMSSAGVDAFPVAVHEYVHLVTRHMVMKLPPWLDEGMAELYSTLKPMGEKVLVGTLIEGRHQALLNEKWVPLDVIVKADHKSPYYNERSQAGSLYNEGWALTHMLVLTNAYRPGFMKFLDLVNTGTPTEEALNKVYGKSIAQVDKELQAYLRGTRFQGAYFSQKLEKANDEITVEPADSFDVKVVLAELLNQPGRAGQAKAALESLAAEDPKRPEPLVTLGFLALRAGDSENALKDFGKAYELGGRDPAMLWDYARMVRPQDQAQAIRVLAELLAKEPARTDVRMELAATLLIANQPGEALEVLKPVNKFAPEDAPRLFGIRAHAQLDLKQWDDAKVSAESVAKFARTDEERFQADRILRYLEARSGGGVGPRFNDSGRPTGSASLEKSIAGSFVLFDCSGKPPKVVLETEQGKKIFLVDDADKVLGSTMELSCGPQNKDRVRVDYIPGNQAGVDGLVRGMRVEP